MNNPTLRVGGHSAIDTQTTDTHTPDTHIYRIQCEEANYGLISYLWPEYRWVFYPYTPFVPESHLIVVCDMERDLYPTKTCIYLTKHKGVKVDTKQGFIEVLGTRWSLNNKLKTALLALDDTEFWDSAKYFWIMGTLPYTTDTDTTASTFKVFKALFSDYGTAYAMYRSMQRSYRAVFSGLMSMMLKSQSELVTADASGVYKRVLQENRIYMGWYRKCVTEYLSSDRRERDFLTFLWQCSQARRGSIR